MATSKRILSVRVRSQLRRVPLAWPRATTRFAGASAVNTFACSMTRTLGEHRVLRPRLIPASALLRPAGEPSAARVAQAAGPVIVRPIWNSGCYEIVDGTPSSSPGDPDRMVECLVEPLPVITPRQQLLLDMSWTETRPILYQPVPFPEVARWPVVRRCDDRFELMAAFLRERGIEGAGHTYVDLACNYGWFVDAMQGLGFDATGVELDGRSPEIARTVYGLDPSRIVTGDVVTYLATPANRADVFSCFSLVHHFVAAGNTDFAERVVRLLAQRSNLGFFFDMGESHEGWLARRLPGWTPERIAEWLGDLCPGMTVAALGTDHDDRGDQATEYGRTLFAVWRTEPGHAA